MATPFAPQQQARPFDIAKSAGVLGGTTLEALAAVGSFGFWEPDIIPEDVEAAHPIASAVGNIAGSVGAFLGTTALTGVAVSVPLKAFRFGRAVMTGASLAKAASVGKSGALTLRGATAFAEASGFAAQRAPQFMAFAPGAVKLAANFGVQDVAREYIRQAKEQDPDAFGLAQAAVGGVLTGGIFGTAHKMFSRDVPWVQLITGGSTFAVAETVNDIVTGEDVTKESIAQSFMTGLAFSIPSAVRFRKTKTEAFGKSKESFEDSTVRRLIVIQRIMQRLCGYLVNLVLGLQNSYVKTAVCLAKLLTLRR